MTKAKNVIGGKSIPVNSRTASVLSFVVNPSTDPKRAVLRVMLESVYFRTRTQTSNMVDAMAPLADALDAVTAEVGSMLAALERGSPTTWRQFVQETPPSPEAIALLLIHQGDKVREEEAAAARAKNNARTLPAREEIERKKKAGGDKSGRAMKELEKLQRSGKAIMGRNVAADIASLVGCDAKTVRNARMNLLLRK